MAFIGSITSSTSSMNRSPIKQVGQMALEVRIAADEAAEAEAVVELAHQPPHALHALREARPPLAQLRGGSVPLGQPFGHGVGGQLARLQRQQHAGRIQRVEKAEGVADQHPAVAGDALARYE